MIAAAGLIQSMLEFNEEDIKGMLVSKIKIGDELELVPVPELYSGVKFGQFIQIDMLFEHCEHYLALPLANRVPDEMLKRVTRVLAAVYRASPFERLDSKAIDYRANLLAESADGKSLGVLYANYRAMRRALEQKYRNVFPKQEQTQDTGKAKNTVSGIKGAKLSDWLGIRDKIAKTFRQKFEDANDMLLHDVLRFMNNELKENV